MNKSTSSSLNIAIVGGSIAGCSAAIVLARLGHNISVFEKSTEQLSDRGAGIVIPKPLFEQLVKLDLLDRELPFVELKSMQYQLQHPDHLEHGKHIWQRPLDGLALHWGHLYQQLRKRIPDHNYYQGKQVRQIDSSDQQASITFTDGNSELFDLVLSCEGLISKGREFVAANAKINYSGYVLWRGVLDECQLAHKALQELQGVRWNPFAGGLAGSYFIANKNGQVNKGQRSLNWGVYQQLTAQQLKIIWPDFNPEQGLGNHQLSTTVTKQLQQLADKNIPADIAQVIKQTDKPFVQPIVDIAAEQLVLQRVVLLGDSAAVLRPHTASGAVKAMQNAISLAQSIGQDKQNLDSNLAVWQEQQLLELQQQVQLSNALGKGWITDAPPWQQMDEVDMDNWWQAMVSGSDWYLNK